jgi:ABC-2 type transport system ATP-binding protein
VAAVASPPVSDPRPSPEPIEPERATPAADATAADATTADASTAAGAGDGAGAVEVRDLVIRYGDHVAVDHLSFTVAPATVTALLGPNGAGKTSTVESLEGYRRPAQGQVRVLGLDPIADHDRLTRRIGVMLQNGGVYTGIRPPEILRLFASYYDDPADPDELLVRVGLQERRRSTWKTLSGGEQQRLSLALALVGRPEVAFLDEPTAGIDPSGRQLIRRVIAQLRQDGVTVLLTTHDLEEAEKLADQVVIIDQGRVLAAGTPAELTRTDQRDEIRFGAAPDLDVASLASAIGAAVTEVSPGEYRVDGAPDPARIAALTSWLASHDLALADLRAGRQRLEDVFLRLTESAAAVDAANEAAAAEAAPAGGRRGPRSRRTRRARS